MQSLLDIQDLAIGYPSGKEKNILLHKMNARLQPGELVAVIGANGTGKSTLLRTLVGLQPPITGHVYHFTDNTFNEVRQLSHRKLARYLAWVSTDQTSVPNLKVADMVAYGRYPHTNWFSHLTDYDWQVVRQSLQHAGMLHMQDRSVDQLSDGERQRVTIARALAQDARLIILDEPTAYLDVENKYEILVLLRHLAHVANKGILLSSHDLHIVLQEADKIWMFDNQRILEEAPEDLVLNGSIDRLFADPRLKFDRQAGNFRYKRPVRGYVNLYAEGIKANWTARALRRKGFELKGNGYPRITIEEKPKISWKLTTRTGKHFQLSSIYNLLRYLERYSTENL